jgi:threonine dehydratase
VTARIEGDFDLPSPDHILAAQKTIQPYIHHTPLLQSRTLNSIAGASPCFKCENFQRGGAFKARGAHNAVFALSDQNAKCGVVTHSSGNHGAAVALAARSRGIPAYVVAPEDSVQKVAKRSTTGQSS